jgi:hypothetical protein
MYFRSTYPYKGKYSRVYEYLSINTREYILVLFLAGLHARLYVICGTPLGTATRYFSTSTMDPYSYPTSAIHDFELRHIDVKTAFLNGPLDEEIFLRKPPGMGPGYWRLKKALYGLKQAGRQWYLTLNDAFKDIGYARSETDWSVHYKRENTKLVGLISGTIVNDIILATDTKTESHHEFDRFAAQLAAR